MYMLKFTQAQFEFLLFVDMQDDWHRSYFFERVSEQYASSPELPFDATEYENLMTELQTLSTDRVANLQFALCAFGNI
ncbi:hypothetical protein COO91_01917 [Nostoc flagelliforme CCNUN1]|uniref:Uncharacterized protein n=2 Tax=Nostoc flagelliforme TaxID=1306274 RepID=A0A2K8SKU0_9NOSO|nr:hypothetical protein COO91_01917 [Nostoc flagelliforme CCNUN1]